MKKLTYEIRHRKNSWFILTCDFFVAHGGGLTGEQGKAQHEQGVDAPLAAFLLFPFTPSGSPDCGTLPCSSHLGQRSSLLVSPPGQHTQIQPTCLGVFLTESIC